MSELSNQCRRTAERDGRVSLMNNTKWRELCFAFSAFGRTPAWRTLDFLTGHLSDWDSEWFHHVGPDYCSIEWLEIDPRNCEIESIRSVLRNIGAPYEESDGYIRVFGYGK
jgi:hypothetical protein